MNTPTINLQNIPLAKLVPSPRNVRKTGGLGITDLVASIRSQGLLQPLVVRPGPGEVFEVDAGGRRLRALREIAATDNLDDTEFKIPCTVLEASDSAEASLAENSIREAMHPADRADAVAKLAADGLSVADIGARFGWADRTVLQALKLSKVAPDIVASYRTGALDLEQVEAFAISDDHESQLKYFRSAVKQVRKGEALRDAWQMEEREIRRALTKGEIGPDDDRLKVVKLKDYEAAGGTVRRDLFDAEDVGYVTDTKLLNQLAQEAVDRKAAEIRDAEGWAWCEGRIKWDYETREKAGYRQISDGYMAKTKFSAEEKGSGGVVVSCSRGGFEITRGLLNAEGVKALRKNDAGKKSKKAAKAKAERKGISDALTLRLTTERTAALQAELIAAPGVALIALAHALALQLLYGDRFDLPTIVTIKSTAALDPGEDTTATAAIKAEHAALVSLLPKNRDELLGFLLQNSEILPRVLAYCTAVTVDWRRHSNIAGEITSALEIARAIGLDMAKYWKPTVDSYLGSVSKDLVIDAVKQAGNEPLASRLVNSKSKPAAAEAETFLADSGWLPEILRAHLVEATPAKKKAKR